MLTWSILSSPSDIHKWSTPRVSGTVPGARDGHSACVLGKTMYIFGGYEQLVSLGRKSRFRVRMRKEGELRLVEWEACLQILRGGMEGQRVTTDPPPSFIPSFTSFLFLLRRTAFPMTFTSWIPAP